MIHFEHRGTGPEVLLIQGTGVAGRGWRPQVDGLAERFHLAWYDNPGIGESDGPPGGMEELVGAALHVLDTLEWKQAHVVGHSLGGVVAQRLALDHPERVRSLGLLCTFARGASTLSFHPAALWHQVRMLVGPREARRRAFFQFVSELEPTEQNMAALEQAFGRGLADLPPAARAQIRVLVAADHREELAGIEVPALVLGALHDRAAPIAQTRLLAELLDTEAHELDGGHAVVVEQADTVNERLAAFWTQVGAGSVSPAS